MEALETQGSSDNPSSTRVHDTRVAVVSALGAESYSGRTLRQMCDRELMAPPPPPPPISTDSPSVQPSGHAAAHAKEPAAEPQAEVITCSECNLIVMGNKIRHHILAVHAKTARNKGKVNEIQRKSEESQRTVKLTKPVGQGARVGPLIMKDEDGAEIVLRSSSIAPIILVGEIDVSTIQGFKGSLKKHGPVKVAQALFHLSNFRREHPKLIALIYDFNKYMRTLKQLEGAQSAQRATTNLIAILVVFLRVKSYPDLGAEGIHLNIFDILNTYRSSVKPELKVSSVKKHIQVIHYLARYLHEKHHLSGGTFIPNFQISVYDTAVKRTHQSMNSDRSWFTAHESLVDKKERQYLPPAAIHKFMTSNFVANILNGATNFAKIRLAADEENLSVKDYLAQLGDEPEEHYIPSFNNAIVLRDVIISVGICETARRSLEMTSFELDEFHNPKYLSNTHSLFKIKNHKTWSSKVCYLRLSNKVTLALCAFVKYFRGHLSNSDDPKAPVFPSSTQKQASERRKLPNLTESSIGQITDKTFRRAGGEFEYRFVPRRIRHSIVTTATNKCSSEDQLLDLAYVMGHSRRTAARHYTIGVVVDKVERARQMIEDVMRSEASTTSSQQVQETAEEEAATASRQAILRMVGLSESAPVIRAQPAYTEEELARMKETVINERAYIQTIVNDEVDDDEETPTETLPEVSDDISDVEPVLPSGREEEEGEEEGTDEHDDMGNASAENEAIQLCNFRLTRFLSENTEQPVNDEDDDFINIHQYNLEQQEQDSRETSDGMSPLLLSASEQMSSV